MPKYFSASAEWQKLTLQMDQGRARRYSADESTLWYKGDSKNALYLLGIYLLGVLYMMRKCEGVLTITWCRVVSFCYPQVDSTGGDSTESHCGPRWIGDLWRGPIFYIQEGMSNFISRLHTPWNILDNGPDRATAASSFQIDGDIIRIGHCKYVKYCRRRMDSCMWRITCLLDMWIYYSPRYCRCLLYSHWCASSLRSDLYIS